jgi:putative peptidoglycan lipid II flippase
MGPRLISMAFIQLIFLARDNLASRLPVGSVTALSYGWWIQQVPETLIGTALATALLPTLSENIAKGDQPAFKAIIERTLRVMIALSLPVAVILSMTSLPLIQTAFGFSLGEAQMILWATQGYLIGLLGHCVVELGVRSFYARQNAKVPMMISGLGLILYLVFAIPLMRILDSGGIALANAISYSVQGVLLIVLLNRRFLEKLNLHGSFLRGAASAVASGLSSWLILSVLPIPLSGLFLSIISIAAGGIIGAVPIWRELRLLINL